MDNQGFKVSSGSVQSLASDTAGHAFRRLLVIVIIVSVACLAMLSAFVIYHRSNVHESKSAHDDLQSKLATSDSRKKERLDQLALEIEQINSDIKQDLDRDINQKYESISKELKDLANASNKEIAISAQSLMQSLSNVAGEGIFVSGSNGTTIRNTGVLSVNQQTGELSLQGVMNQTTVNQSGKITTIGTAQDISPGSSPTFNSQTLNGNQTIAGNGEIQGNMIVQGSITGDTLAIGTSGTQNGYAICDASNNCGYSGAGSSFVQGGNSFGNPANIGTNDTQPLNVETNGVTRLSIDASGNSAFIGNVSSNGTISANSLSGNGSGVTNVNATVLNGNTAGNSNGQIAINNGTVNTNLNADLLDGQHGSFYQDASNINSGVVADARLSGNVTLQGNAFNGANQLVQLTASGLLPTLDGSSLQNLNAGNVGIGTLADARLSSNVALKNTTNTFTGTNNFAGLTATGILQNGYQVCDASNNCGYATNTQFSNAILQGGNSFGAQMTIGTNDNQAFAVKTNNTERLTVLANGNVGIGVAPQSKLHVEDSSGNTSDTWVARFINNSTVSNSDGVLIETGATSDSSNPLVVRRTGGTNYLSILSNGFTNIGNVSHQTSTARLAVYSNSDFLSYPVIVAKAIAGQTGDLLQARDSTNNNLFRVTSMGAIYQGTNQVCDTSNNCNYATSGQFANAILQGGNSFGTQMTIGTNDNQAFAVKTNGTERLIINSNGNIIVGSSSFQALLNIGVNSSSLYSASSLPSDQTTSLLVRNANDTVGTGSFIRLVSGTSAENIAYIGTLKSNSGASSLLFGTRNNGGTGYGEKMRITESGNVSIGTVSDLGQLGVVSTASNKVGLVVQGASGQTANLQEWRNSGGSQLIQISKDGYLTLGTNIVSGMPSVLKVNLPSGSNGDYMRILSGTGYTVNGVSTHRVFAGDFASPGVVGIGIPGAVPDIQGLGNWGDVGVMGAAGGNTGGRLHVGVYGHSYISQILSGNSGNSAQAGVFVSRITDAVTDFNGSLYGVRASADSTAGIQTGGTLYGVNGQATGETNNTVYGGYFQASGTGTNVSLQATAGTSATVGMVVQGASGQTANLQEWRGSAGQTLSYLNGNGDLSIGTSSSISTYARMQIKNGTTIMSFDPDSSLKVNGVSNTTKLFTNENKGPASLALAGIGPNQEIAPLSTYGSIASYSLAQGCCNRLVIGSRGEALEYGGSSNILYGTQGIAKFGGDGVTGYSNGVGVYGEVNTNQLGTAISRIGYGVQGVANSGSGTTVYGGYFKAQGTGNNISLQSTAGSASTIGMVVQGASGQTADLFQAQNSAGTVLAKIDASGNLTVKSATVQGDLSVSGNATFSGSHISFSNNIRGYNIAVSASATSQVVTFGTAHPDANYAVFCTPDWNTTCYVTNKTVNGFTLNYGTSAPAGQLVDWFVAR